MPTLWMRDIQARKLRKAREHAEAKAKGEAEAARLDRVSRQLANPTEKVPKVKMSRKDYRQRHGDQAD